MIYLIKICFLINLCFVTDATNNGRTQGSGRSQTKNEQLLALLANRRRHIIESRFRNHIKTIVELAKNNANTSKHGAVPINNSTTSLNIHLRLNDLLTDNITIASGSEDLLQQNDNKTKTSNKTMPLIRNILFRRKMSFLNRKLPVDFDPDSYDAIALSAISKTGEDLISDAEDSLQVEESSHDKLIYYDVKNNSTKQSMNNFDDTSEELKTMSMNNKTFHGKINTEQKEINVTKTKLDNNETTSKRLNNKPDNKTEVKATKNNTHFMSQSVYNHFRPPEDVPLEEMQPFLHFGDKIPVAKTDKVSNKSQSSKLTPKEKLFIDETITHKNEEEIDEHMDVAITKSIYENKIPKVPIPNQKSTIVQQYMKNRSYNVTKSLSEKNTTKSVDRTNVNIPRIKNSARHRGFRNRTIFFHQKRNGMRQTINLNSNTSIANLKPINTDNLDILLEDEENKSVSKSIGQRTTKALPLKMEETTTIKSTKTFTTEANLSSTAEKTSKLSTLSTERTTKSISTAIAPTTNVLSTDVVTSISISKSSISERNKTLGMLDSTVPDLTNSEAKVIAQLNNFTFQSFNNNSESVINKQKQHTLDLPTIKTHKNSTEIDKPTPVFYLNKTDFIIHVPDTDTTTINSIGNSNVNEETDISAKEIENTTYMSETHSEDVTKKDVSQTITSSTTRKPKPSSSTAQTQTPTKSTKNIGFFNLFNTTNGELPLATLFNVIDLKKPEYDPLYNTTKLTIATETVISRKKQNGSSFDNVHAAYILASLGLIPMFIILIYVVRNFMKRKNKCFEDFDTELDDKTNFITPVVRQSSMLSDTSPPPPPPSKWEFPRSKLRLQTLLGQGNFGQVWKAEADDLKGHVGLTRLVAVKTIKNDASEKDRQDLLKELAIMQKMGSHSNVVTLLGCCTDKGKFKNLYFYSYYLVTRSECIITSDTIRTDMRK